MGDFFGQEVKHYILNLNPQADYDWDKCVLRNPLTGERLDLTNAIAETVNQEAGSYLISVNIEVKVLEKTTIAQSSGKTIELPTSKQAIQPNKLLAS